MSELSASRPARPADVVRAFLEIVRTGREPDRAGEFFAPQVAAHQVAAEAAHEAVVTRTPADYAAHVREMRAAFGEFTFAITELLADGDRVYARWRQTGRHVGEIDGFAPTQRPLVEIASAVYRVEAGKIFEYWSQIDRAGLRAQLETNAAT